MTNGRAVETRKHAALYLLMLSQALQSSKGGSTFYASEMHSESTGIVEVKVESIDREVPDNDTRSFGPLVIVFFMQMR